MKVLHITYTDAGGAGIAAMRIHQSLRRQGIDSSMLVAEKTSYDDNVLTAETCFRPSYIPPKNMILKKIKKMARKRGHFLSTEEHYNRLVELIPSTHKTFFTSPLSSYNLNQHPAVTEADIIHLHWVANFVNYPTFFPAINKPIVWTLHDENLAYGGFHYGREREQYYPYYAEVEDAYCRIKQSSLAQCKDIHVVALSKMMEDFYKTHSFLSDRPTTIIHNGIDTSIFHPLDRNIGRQVYHIPENKYVIVFCCVNLNDRRKGLAELVEAISKLQRPDITLLCIGSGHFNTDLPVDIKYTGPINNPYLLAMTYSCGDLFAFPSYQEAFAQAPLEAIACGLPIVAFPCSGMEELINADNGVFCQDFTTESLVEGLREVTNKDYDTSILHNDIAQRFNSTVIANHYINLYNKILHP
ncbi:MAG: glycosyltransferase [Elusimicrobiaceae bacterium]|nr:glycosyltransferase [Elusimicrobiaceae bacterium]